jgi:ACT domain-containing protein
MDTMILGIHFSDTEVGLSVQLFDRYGKLINVLNKKSDLGWNLTVMNFHQQIIGLL